MKLCKQCIIAIKKATGLTSWDGFYDASNRPKHYFVAKRGMGEQERDMMWFEVVPKLECEFPAHKDFNDVIASTAARL
jgi:hypothetical protein